MQLQYGLYPTNNNDKNSFTKGTNEKVLKFKAVQSNGIVVEMSIKGPKETVEKEFLTFGIARGVKILMILDSSQQTLVSQLIAAPKAKKQAQKALDGGVATAPDPNTNGSTPAGSDPPVDPDNDGSQDPEEDEGEEEETLEDVIKKIGDKPTKTKVKA